MKSIKLFLITASILYILVRRSAAQENKNALAEGEKVYIKYKCAACHGRSGDKPYDLTAASEKYDHQTLKRYIMNPRDFENMQMPVFQSVISENEYAPLIQYLDTLNVLAVRKLKNDHRQK
jgi:mono/diheme cytochrome c family protein